MTDKKTGKDASGLPPSPPPSPSVLKLRTRENAAGARFYIHSMRRMPDRNKKLRTPFRMRDRVRKEMS